MYSENRGSYFCFHGNGTATPTPLTTNGSLTLEKFDGGFFSMSKPEGWRVITAGACGNFAFLIQDPSEPLRQIFYFGEVGPVYMSQQQKQIDAQYMNMSGYPIPWIDMPVVSPLTPSNFISQFHLIAQSQIAQNFMPQCPTLEICKSFRQFHSRAQSTVAVRNSYEHCLLKAEIWERVCFWSRLLLLCHLWEAPGEAVRTDF